MNASPKRRWFQFSLKALILVLVVCGCVLAPIAYEHQKARNQHAAVAALEKRGGYLGFDSTTHPRSAAMSLLLGDDKFAHLVAVDFAPGSVITDPDLLHLRSFSFLRFVGLDGMPVTDASLVELGSKTMLTELSLKNTKITDAGPLQHQTTQPPQQPRAARRTARGIGYFRSSSNLVSNWICSCCIATNSIHCCWRSVSTFVCNARISNSAFKLTS